MNMKKITVYPMQTHGWSLGHSQLHVPPSQRGVFYIPLQFWVPVVTYNQISLYVNMQTSTYSQIDISIVLITADNLSRVTLTYACARIHIVTRMTASEVQREHGSLALYVWWWSKYQIGNYILGEIHTQTHCWVSNTLTELLWSFWKWVWLYHVYSIPLTRVLGSEKLSETLPAVFSEQISMSSSTRSLAWGMLYMNDSLLAEFPSGI